MVFLFLVWYAFNAFYNGKSPCSFLHLIDWLYPILHIIMTLHRPHCIARYCLMFLLFLVAFASDVCLTSHLSYLNVFFISGRFYRN